MLKNIPPVLTPDLLKVLAEMGHGDEIAVVDANFAAMSLGRGKPVLNLAGADLRCAAHAILTLLPLDEAVAQPVAYMLVGGRADDYLSALQHDVIERCEAAAGVGRAGCAGLERFAFYARAREAFAIVQTGELEPFANFIFKKGVLAQLPS